MADGTADWRTGGTSSPRTSRSEPQRREHRVRARRPALPRARRRWGQRRPARHRQRAGPEHRPRQDPADRSGRPDGAAVDQRRPQPVAVQLRPRQRDLWVADVARPPGRRSPTSRGARSRAATSGGGASRATTASRAPGPSHTPPIYEYSHARGARSPAATYRGSKIPTWSGRTSSRLCDGRSAGYPGRGRVGRLAASARTPGASCRSARPPTGTSTCSPHAVCRIDPA